VRCAFTRCTCASFGFDFTMCTAGALDSTGSGAFACEAAKVDGPVEVALAVVAGGTDTVMLCDAAAVAGAGPLELGELETGAVSPVCGAADASVESEADGVELVSPAVVDDPSPAVVVVDPLPSVAVDWSPELAVPGSVVVELCVPGSLVDVPPVLPSLVPGSVEVDPDPVEVDPVEVEPVEVESAPVESELLPEPAVGSVAGSVEVVLVDDVSPDESVADAGVVAPESARAPGAVNAPAATASVRRTASRAAKPRSYRLPPSLRVTAVSLSSFPLSSPTSRSPARQALPCRHEVKQRIQFFPTGRTRGKN